MTRRNTNNATTLARQVQAWLNALDSTGSVLRSEFDGHVADPNPHGNMKWKNEWVQGTYELFDVVRDGGWAMVANKQTTDRAGPQPTGTPVWTVPDAPTWTVNQYTGVVYTAVETTIPANSLYSVLALRAWLPDVSVNANYRVIIYDPVNDIWDFGVPFTGDVLLAPGWIEVTQSANLFTAGNRVVIALESYSSAATTDFNHPWSYEGTLQAGAPAAGFWNRDNQHLIVRLDYNDADGTSRQTELASVVAGTIIRFAEEATPTNYWDYVVNTTTDSVGYYTYTVTLQDTGGLGVTELARCTVSFQVPVADPTDYVELTNGYSTAPNLQGYIAFDDITGGTNNQNAYGIDAQWQTYTASEDWDVLAISDVASGGGGARDPRVFVTAFNNSATLYSLVFWNRFLPVEKENLVKAMNRVPWPGGGGIPTWAEVYEYELFMNYTSQYFVNVNDPFIVQSVNNLEAAAIIGAGRAAVILAH